MVSDYDYWSFGGYIYSFLKTTWVVTQLVERSLTWESVRVKGSEIQSAFDELNGFFHKGQQSYNSKFFFLISVRGRNTSVQRSHHSKVLIFPDAPAISLSPKTYQAQGTLKRQFHCSGQGGWLGGHVQRSLQSFSLGDTSPVLFSLELPWGGKLGLEPFPHRGL